MKFLAETDEAPDRFGAGDVPVAPAAERQMRQQDFPASDVAQAAFAIADAMMIEGER